MGHASHPVEIESPKSNFPLMRTVAMIPMLALLIFFGAEVARNLHYPVLSTIVFLPIFGAIAIIFTQARPCHSSTVDGPFSQHNDFPAKSSSLYELRQGHRHNAVRGTLFMDTDMVN